VDKKQPFSSFRAWSMSQTIPFQWLKAVEKIISFHALSHSPTFAANNFKT